MTSLIGCLVKYIIRQDSEKCQESIKANKGMIPTTPDINVVEINLPTSISAYVASNPDATYTIFLNSRLTWERRLQAYQHELKHIESGDYERRSADFIELYAHEIN